MKNFFHAVENFVSYNKNFLKLYKFLHIDKYSLKIYHTNKMNTMKAFYNYFRQKFTSSHIKLVNKSIILLKSHKYLKMGMDKTEEKSKFAMIF